jgi:hypothetical protein
MSISDSHDPIAALNQVLSVVIDMELDLKQAHQKVPASHALSVVIDRLFDDLRGWAGSILDEDRELGVSPLASMPSVAGRVPPNLWPGTASDEEVSQVLGQHLDRLQQHVTAALAVQEDEAARSTLAEMERGLLAHRRSLSHPGSAQ